MGNKIKWLVFSIGVILLAGLTCIETGIRKFNRYVESGVNKLDPRSLEEQSEAFMDGMYQYCKENFTEKA